MAKNQKGGKDADLRVDASRDTSRVVRRTFPGPAESNAPLRVHFARRAYAELTAHAKESVDAEVGGVLVGEVCEDDNGPFVDVHAIIRATAAREARAHVTFTHETWTQIHAVLDREYRGMQIVGWYHTHPGFGVEFSAMDRFIQQNFFSGKTQIAYLTDPLGGETAICFNAPSGIEPIGKFWVDGREHSARMPASAVAVSESGGESRGGSPDLRREIDRLEGRINQLIRVSDEQRTIIQRMVTTIVVVACASMIAAVAYFIWSDRMERLEPPRTRNYVQLPVRVGDETLLIGVEVVDWKVPDRYNALLRELARAEVEARMKQQEQLRELQKQRKAPAKK
jgi:proteasome lid subunit RPN8/RPN11